MVTASVNASAPTTLATRKIYTFRDATKHQRIQSRNSNLKNIRWKNTRPIVIVFCSHMPPKKYFMNEVEHEKAVVFVTFKVIEKISKRNDGYFMEYRQIRKLFKLCGKIHCSEFKIF